MSPRSPTGRGTGFKYRQVRVRIPPRAHAGMGRQDGSTRPEPLPVPTPKRHRPGGDVTVEITPVSYDIPGAALATGLSERTLRDYIRNGDLAVHYSGTKPVIEREELQAFIRALPSEKRRAS